MTYIQILGMADGTEIRLPEEIRLPDEYEEWGIFEKDMEDLGLEDVTKAILRQFANGCCKTQFEYVELDETELEDGELIDLTEEELEDYIDAY